MKQKFSLETIEGIGKALIVLVALMYALGLMVSTQHLSSFGISDFNGLRPKYVATGLWALLLLFAATFPALFVISTVANLKSLKPYPRFIFFLVSAPIAGFMAANLCQYFLLVTLDISIFEVGKEINALNRSVTLVVLVFYGLWRIPKYFKAKLVDVPFYAAFLMPILVFVGARNYVNAVYVRVPEALGGAKPVPAELVLNRDGTEFWKQAGMSTVNSQTSSTGTVMILYQSEHDFVIKAPYKDGQQAKEKLIVLNKSLVNGFLPAEQH